MGEYLSVTELNTYIKQIFDAEDLLHRICVVGEVSGFSIRGFHAYFTLKDENSQLRCCLFNYAKTYVPKDGELILVGGSIDYYLKGGYISFNASVIEPYGKGLMATKLEELKKRLEKEGYFSEEHKKEIPRFVKRAAVITSRDGAVIKDIIKTVRKCNYFTDIDYFDVKVQGIGSADTIVNTLKKVDLLGYDIIIIARGGGSMEDLMGFNDERLVYAIYAANTPIVSAVGHETDYTLCDFVADVRVPTPTAAGELIAYDIDEIKERIGYKISRALGDIKGKYQICKNAFSVDAKRMISGMQMRQFEAMRDIKSLLKDFRVALQYKNEGCVKRVGELIRVLDAVNPAKILEKGFVKISNSSGKFVEGISSLSQGDNVYIEAKDGRAKAEILEVIKENDYGKEIR